MNNNTANFIPHRVNRKFENGVPKWDFVIIVYRPLTPTGRESKIKKIYCHTERYAHGATTDTAKVNTALVNGQQKKKPYLPKNYKWAPQLMRVD